MDDVGDKPSGSNEPMEKWRLLCPPPVGYFINDCVIQSTLTIIGSQTEWPYHPDDEYQSRYNSHRVKANDLAVMMDEDESSYSFAPGAPVSLNLLYITMLYSRHILEKNLMSSTGFCVY
jgi:hypothetical protein